MERLIDGARAGRSGVLVVRGEAGIGKTVLLDHAAASATGLRVLTGTGIEAEVALPFAGLHLLFNRHFDRIDGLPPAQARALRGALGLAVVDPAAGSDRFLVGLAVLTLLADVAEERPLLCLVDDAHWFDQASTDALLFAARRLEAEGVVLVFAVREPHGPAFPATGLPELRLSCLDTEAAEAVLAVHGGGLPQHEKRQILEQARGNPLALREMAVARRQSFTPSHPYGVAGLPVHSRIQQSFADRVAVLPERTRDLLLVAAADGSCDTGNVVKAAERLGSSAADLQLAQDHELLMFNEGCIGFVHPLIRAAVYQGAPLDRKLAAHQALADVLDERADAGRRAWHLAAGSTGPDEEIAAMLERTAEDGRAHGGHAAPAAAAYQQAAALSTGPAERGRRLAAAARAAAESGQLDWAATLADQAAGLLTDPVALGEVALIRAAVADERGRPAEAHGILADAAVPAAARAPETARRMFFSAVETAWAASDPAAIERAVREAGRLGLDQDGRVRRLAALRTGAPGALDALRELLASAGGLSEPRDRVAVAGWQLLRGADLAAHELAAGVVRAGRAGGALGVLPSALAVLAETELHLGRPHDALAGATEGLRLAKEIGQRQHAGRLSGVLARLAAIEGAERRCAELAADAAAEGGPAGAVRAWLALGLLDLGLGRHEAVLGRMSEYHSVPGGLEVAAGLPDLVEAAVRSGRGDLAEAATASYRDWSVHSGQSWAEAVALRCQALLVEDADALFTEALRAHGRDGTRPFERARTELLYGEWLRRARRRTDARGRLRSAGETFERLGATPWAERAGTELRATGESRTAREHGPDPLARLTPQELQVVRLAATGLSNRDIGAQLFLSPRTVGYHLYKAYPKLGVASRAELTRFDLAA